MPDIDTHINQLSEAHTDIKAALRKSKKQIARDGKLSQEFSIGDKVEVARNGHPYVIMSRDLDAAPNLRSEKSPLRNGGQDRFRGGSWLVSVS